MFDKDKFKESLTVEDIKVVLKYYEADFFEGKNGEIISETICHHRSGGSHKLYYYPDTHTFHCYTGCGSFDIYELINKRLKMDRNEVSFTDCIKTLGNILNVHIDFSQRLKGVQRQIKRVKDWDWLNKLKRKEPIEPELKIHSSNILKFFPEIFPSAWYEEGISIESMEKYNIKFYPEMFQTVIPHVNERGELVGIRSRNWDKELKKKAKYIPTYISGKAYNHPLGYNLYGLYQNKEAIKRKKKVMIVEGEKSCLFADTFYNDNNFVVAICGSNMSKYQADLLLKLGIEEVIIAIDKEYLMTDTPEYEEYMNKVNKIGKYFVPFVRVYHLTDTKGLLGLKESPLDRSKEELEQMMRIDKHKLTLDEVYLKK